ncbi:dynein light intermediate chain [Anaeramoeba flamelloides]|uniref:Dynein light intermediate chain n=1 Tax=Anaeramoeba flamelloides TaxID=1746091 RepID=A0AAV7Y7R6_9EUKA|nr:dynein light intermediate chain [Anaeramoeba flamelloides]
MTDFIKKKEIKGTYLQEIEEEEKSIEIVRSSDETDTDSDRTEEEEILNKDETTDGEPALWASLLKRVTTKKSVPESSTLLILGDPSSGKTSLFFKYLKTDRNLVGIGLNYSYLDVSSTNDESEDIISRIDVWQINDSKNHKDLLEFAISEDTLDHLSVVICLDTTTPWKMYSSLKKWLNVIEETLTSDHTSKIDQQKLNFIKRKQMQRVLNYQKLEAEISENEQPKLQKMNTVRKSSRYSKKELQKLSMDDMPKDSLIKNFGIPIVVAYTKTDEMIDTQKKHSIDVDQMEYIQGKIRRLCLQYGAAFIYTSVKLDTNIDLLREYIFHLNYTFPFNQMAITVNKDQLFYPIGSESDQKINALYKNIDYKEDQPYKEVVQPPKVEKTSSIKDQRVKTEENPKFLRRLDDILKKTHQYSSPKVKELGPNFRKEQNLLPSQPNKEYLSPRNRKSVRKISQKNKNSQLTPKKEKSNPLSKRIPKSSLSKKRKKGAKLKTDNDIHNFFTQFLEKKDSPYSRKPLKKK